MVKIPTQVYTGSSGTHYVYWAPLKYAVTVQFVSLNTNANSTPNPNTNPNPNSNPNPNANPK